MLNEFDFLKSPFNMDLAYFNIYIQDDEIFVPWRCSESNPEKCIYKREVKTKKDLEDGILNVKWSTIDIPLINFNHFDVLDSLYFGKVESIECVVEKKTKNALSDIKINSIIVPNSRESIQKIRDGIRNGTIVKEMKSDGSYIWKKVRK